MKSRHALPFAVLLSTATAAEPASRLERFASYRQGEPLAHLLETRGAVFAGTADETTRAARERELLEFIASNAQAEAKAIAIEWLGVLGTSASVPALATALGEPALAGAAATALERIPGPEAKTARPRQSTNTTPISPQAAEVERFHASLVPENAVERISAALVSPNELLAGAALRRIRAGNGPPDLAGKLLTAIDLLPPHRQAPLLDALATRKESIHTLHTLLVARVRAGDAASLAILGRILRPDDLPMVLEIMAKPSQPELAAAATSTLARATDPGINPGLVRHATAITPTSPAAIDALAARHALEAVDTLWSLTTASDASVSAAAFSALGAILPPDSLAGLIDKLAATNGNPADDSFSKLLWNITRRHPDPAAAASLLEQRAAAASPVIQPILTRYATRIRPKNTVPQPQLELPAEDDSAMLAPDHHERVVSLNCGTFTTARAGGVTIRRSSGSSYQFGNLAHSLATVDFGREITYELSGLDADTDYVLGFSAWDADGQGRRQSLAVNGTNLLPDFAPIAYHAGKPTYLRVHLPLKRELTATGTATVTMKSIAGPNAVISELRLLRRTTDAPRDVKRVVIVTGDDYPAHLWRLTGPEFVRMLRADPRLEVTVSESPSLLGSPALASFDAVFLHFKNYHERVPTNAAMWNNLESYVHNGGGLVIAHFGCGAMQEWNGFVKIAGRVWNPKLRGHDPYGEFLIRILQSGHPATRGVPDFTTTDELYTCLDGDTRINVLAEATSKVDQMDYPMAFVLTPGKGRVFHSPLGHDLRALKAEGARLLYLQGTRWAVGETNQSQEKQSTDER
jgi:type 1 glutamine amidotransferase